MGKGTTGTVGDGAELLSPCSSLVYSLSCRDTFVGGTCAPSSAVLVNYAVAADDATVTIILFERAVWKTEHSTTEANRLINTCVQLTL